MTAAVGLDTVTQFLTPSLSSGNGTNTMSFDSVMDLFATGNNAKETLSGIKTGLTFNGFISDMSNMEMSPEEIIDKIIEKTKEKYETSDKETGLTSENKDKLIQISQLLDLVISLMMSKTMDGKYEAGDYPKLSEMIKEFTTAINNIATVNTETLDDLLEKLTDLVLEMTGEDNTENKFEVSDKFEKMCRDKIEQFERASYSAGVSQNAVSNIILENVTDI